mgnify:CR=1 FL=1
MSGVAIHFRCLWVEWSLSIDAIVGVVISNMVRSVRIIRVVSVSLPELTHHTLQQPRLALVTNHVRLHSLLLSSRFLPQMFVSAGSRPNPESVTETLEPLRYRSHSLRSRALPRLVDPGTNRLNLRLGRCH